MLGDLVALLFGHRPGRLAEGPLQLGRGVDVFHLAAGGADEVVVVSRELLGQLESAVVVRAATRRTTPTSMRAVMFR